MLQHGEIQTVGGEHTFKVDTRVIAATNRNLREEVAQGRFRADLYHRLTVFPIHVPPLRERREDIALLAGFFGEKCRDKLKLRQLILTPCALQTLSRYPWPGNIRELEHCIYRSAILAKSQSANLYVTIDSSKLHLEDDNFAEQSAIALQMENHATSTVNTAQTLIAATEQFQRAYIKQSLQRNNSNWTQTALELGLDNGNLHRKAKKLGLKKAQ